MAFETVKFRKPLLLRILPILSIVLFFTVWEVSVAPPGCERLANTDNAAGKPFDHFDARHR